MAKLLTIILLFASLCALSKTAPRGCLNACIAITTDTIPEIVVQISKSDRYNIYLKDCNQLITDTILQTGYIQFDTIRAKTIPANPTYFGKRIVKAVQLSVEIANIVVADTVWNEINAPEYRSSWNYYFLAHHPMPEVKLPDFDYSDKIIVKRLREYTWKKSRPLDFNDWEKYIYNKPVRTSQKENYF